jgi:hypothetical protein
MRKISASIAMDLKLLKRRKLSKSVSIRGHLMLRNTCFMEKLINSQTLRREML